MGLCAPIGAPECRLEVSGMVRLVDGFAHGQPGPQPVSWSVTFLAAADGHCLDHLLPGGCKMLIFYLGCSFSISHLE